MISFARRAAGWRKSLMVNGGQNTAPSQFLTEEYFPYKIMSHPSLSPHAHPRPQPCHLLEEPRIARIHRLRPVDPRLSRHKSRHRPGHDNSGAPGHARPAPCSFPLAILQRPSGRSRPRPCGPRLHGHGTTFGQMGRLPCRANCLATSYISLSVVYAYYEDS